MDKSSKDRLKRIAVVPIGLILILAPFSLLIGWNLVTLFLFWFILTPLATIYLPQWLVATRTHLLESLVGLSIFYAFMVFMIYEHYHSDYFQFMMVSGIVNLIVVTMISFLRRTQTQL